MTLRKDSTRKTFLQTIIAIVAVTFTSELHSLFPNGNFATIVSLVVPVLYISFIIFWTATAFIRVMQKEVKRYIISISFAEIFWLLIRYIRLNFTTDVMSSRHLWYLYYVGTILIPLFMLFIALAIGHDEHYHIPVRFKLLYVPALIIITEVFSNDFQQLTFRFKNGLNDYAEYSYGVVYYLVIAWIAACMLISWYLFSSKCRIRRGRVDSRLAYIPIIFIILVCLTDGLNHTIFSSSRFSPDITSLYCLSVLFLLEIFIRCGIIQSNTGYNKAFNISTNGMLVTDKKNRIIAQSKSFTYDPDEISQLSPGNTILKDQKRISKIKTHTGSIVWEDDISRLLFSIEELMDLNDQLSENIDMLQEEYDASRRHQKLVERNRIYDLMQAQTTSRIKQVSNLINDLEQCTDSELEKDILTRLVILTTYIKRRNNLIFLAEDNNMLPVTELAFCIRETTDNMKLYGITSGYHISLDGRLAIYTIMNIYDMIQDVISLAYEGMSYFYVSLKKNELVTLTIRVDTTTNLLAKSDLKKYAGSDITLEQEDDDSYIVIFRTAEE